MTLGMHMEVETKIPSYDNSGRSLRLLGSSYVGIFPVQFKL